MATFEAKCPLCMVEFSAEEAWIGQIGECPSCGQEITVQSPAMKSLTMKSPNTPKAYSKTGNRINESSSHRAMEYKSNKSRNNIFCRSCGGRISEKAVVCLSCGMNPNAGSSYCFACGATTKDKQIICTACGGKVKRGGGKATAGMIMGIAGLILWLLPILGIPNCIIGLILSIKGMNSSKPVSAKVGLILNIIGIVVAIINASIGAYMGATGQLFR